MLAPPTRRCARCIVTTDAMGCQKKIASQVIEQAGDYVLALKGNQAHLLAAAEALFIENNDISSDQFDVYETHEKGHGRLETRRYYTAPASLANIPNKEEWPELKTLGMVESIREVGHQVEHEFRFYIASIKSDAKLFGGAVRKHWRVENNLHWALDVSFGEDSSRIRRDNAAENFGLLRRIALNLLRQEQSVKVGIKNKRLKAGWDHRYLTKVLQGLQV